MLLFTVKIKFQLDVNLSFVVVGSNFRQTILIVEGETTLSFSSINHAKS